VADLNSESYNIIIAIFFRFLREIPITFLIFYDYRVKSLIFKAK